MKLRTVQHANQWPDDDKCWRFAFTESLIRNHLFVQKGDTIP